MRNKALMALAFVATPALAQAQTAAPPASAAATPPREWIDQTTGHRVKGAIF